MSTRIHRFVPSDIDFVPPSAATAATITWLKTMVDAYLIEATEPDHITFFDCGAGLETVSCPTCGVDIGDLLWKDWMDASYAEATGFTMSQKTLACCETTVALNQLIFDAPCAFGRFAIEITDTLTSLTDDEVAQLMNEAGSKLGSALMRIDAHY